MKNKILLIMLIIAGAIAGSIAAKGAANSDMLSWLAYSKEIGIDPTNINLVIIDLTIGFNFSMNVAQIIFMLAAVAIFFVQAAVCVSHNQAICIFLHLHSVPSVPA